jgi:hypothetical protein
VETDLEELLADMAGLGEAATLLVACGFDGALSPDGEDRAVQQSSEALNVLLALPGTTVAVVSRRPADEVSELMFLSGSKGGLRMCAPGDLPDLRREVGGLALVIDVDPESLEELGPDDVGVLVDDDEDPEDDGLRRVADADEVIEVLEELVTARRH